MSNQWWQNLGIARLTNPATDFFQGNRPSGTGGIKPASSVDPESQFNIRDAEYNWQRGQYDDWVQNLTQSQTRHNRSNTLFNQLEQQRGNNAGYGNNRFYANGEIYNYNPQTGAYQGSISGNTIGQQPAWDASTQGAPPVNPGSYEDYMADDPYYQSLPDTDGSGTGSSANSQGEIDRLNQIVENANLPTTPNPGNPLLPWDRPDRYKWYMDRWIKVDGTGRR